MFFQTPSALLSPPEITHWIRSLGTVAFISWASVSTIHVSKLVFQVPTSDIVILGLLDQLPQYIRISPSSSSAPLPPFTRKNLKAMHVFKQ